MMVWSIRVLPGEHLLVSKSELHKVEFVRTVSSGFLELEDNLGNTLQMPVRNDKFLEYEPLKDFGNIVKITNIGDSAMKFAIVEQLT